MRLLIDHAEILKPQAKDMNRQSRLNSSQAIPGHPQLAANFVQIR
jgi:hypothetical protein